MQNWIQLTISIILGLLTLAVNIALFAYGYGKLSQMVADMKGAHEKEVDSLKETIKGYIPRTEVEERFRTVHDRIDMSFQSLEGRLDAANNALNTQISRLVDEFGKFRTENQSYIASVKADILTIVQTALGSGGKA